MVPGPSGNLSNLAPFGLPKPLRVTSLCVGEKVDNGSRGWKGSASSKPGSGMPVESMSCSLVHLLQGRP